MESLKKVSRYLTGTIGYGLKFQLAKALFLEGFTDADWASNIDDRRSLLVVIVFFLEEIWFNGVLESKVIVGRSNIESKYQTLAQATIEIVWLQSLFAELKTMHSPTLWYDNIGAGSLASNPMFHARIKHVEIDIPFVRERVIAKELDVRFVPTEEKLADLLTKPLTTTRFELICDKFIFSKA